MAVDPEALRSAVEDLISALAVQGSARVERQTQDAQLAVASAAVDAAVAAENAAHADVVAKAGALKALVDEAG